VLEGSDLRDNRDRQDLQRQQDQIDAPAKRAAEKAARISATTLEFGMTPNSGMAAASTETAAI
jgi:hypothetical protein